MLHYGGKDAFDYEELLDVVGCHLQLVILCESDCCSLSAEGCLVLQQNGNALADHLIEDLLNECLGKDYDFPVDWSELQLIVDKGELMHGVGVEVEVGRANEERMRHFSDYVPSVETQRSESWHIFSPESKDLSLREAAHKLLVLIPPEAVLKANL